MAVRPTGELAFLAAAAAGALALVLYLTFRASRKTASKSQIDDDSGIENDEKSEVSEPDNDATTKDVTTFSGGNTGTDFGVVSQYSKEPHASSLPDFSKEKATQRDENTILEEHTQYFDIYSNQINHSDTDKTSLYTNNTDVTYSQTSNSKLLHSDSYEQNLHSDVHAQNACDPNVSYPNVHSNEEIVPYSEICVSKSPQQCKDEDNQSNAQCISNAARAAYEHRTVEMPPYSEQTLPQSGSEASIDSNCISPKLSDTSISVLAEELEQTLQIQKDSEAVSHQQEENCKCLIEGKKTTSSERGRQVEASETKETDGTQFSVSFVPEYEATFHCYQDVPPEIYHQKDEKLDPSKMSFHEEDYEKYEEQEHVYKSSRENPVPEEEDPTAADIIEADSGHQTVNSTPCLFAIPETNEFAENTDVHFIQFDEPTDDMLRVDGGEMQAYLDLDYDGDMSSGSSSNDSDPLSELHIFGRLPPPYGYEETATTFCETAEPTYSSSEIAFSPPSEFKDSDLNVLLSHTEPSHKVPRNGHTSGITFSIMSSYSSSLYTHYEESENEADSHKDAPSLDSDEDAHPSCDQVIFEIDVNDKSPSEPLQENQVEHSSTKTDAKEIVEQFAVQHNQVKESDVLHNTEILVKNDDEKSLTTAQNDMQMFSEQKTSSTEPSLSQKIETLSLTQHNRYTEDVNTESDSGDADCQLSDGQILQQSCKNVAEQKPVAYMQNSIWEEDNDKEDSDSSASSNDTVVLCDTFGHEVAADSVDEQSHEGSVTENKILPGVLLSEAGDVPPEGTAVVAPKGAPEKPVAGVPADSKSVDGASGKAVAGVSGEGKSEDGAAGKPAADVSGDAKLGDGVPVPAAPSEGKSAEVSYTAVEKTLGHVSGDAGSMTAVEAQVLTEALSTKDHELQEKVLITIGNAAAFHKNLVLLRDAGCLRRLIHLLSAHTMALRVGQSVSYPSIVTRVVNTITNLAADEENQQQLQECIPALIDFAKSESSPESVQVSSLQALINLSVTSAYHPPYTQLIQHLYECLDTGSDTLQLHALKVLINLSVNPDMVPHLLAAKAPTSLLASIVPQAQEDYLLRWMTLLANVMWTAREKKLTNTSLPTEYKAASPETMWTAIYGLSTKGHLRSKVFVLSKHKNQEIRYYASRIYSCLI